MKRLIVRYSVYVLFVCILCGPAFPLGKGEPGAKAAAISVTDCRGAEIALAKPAERVFSINSGLTEIAAALHAEGKLVGRCSLSTFPPSVRTVPVVAENSSTPNMELIISKEPDIVLVDTMFDESDRKKLNALGIQVLVESTSTPDYIPEIIRKLGLILGKEGRAEELISLLTDEERKITDRILRMKESGMKQPLVFFENRKAYQSASELTGHHRFITLAGGINIAEGQPVQSPALSPEYIVERNPDVIIKRISGDAEESVMADILASVERRPAIKTVSALKNKRIHIVKADLFLSVRYPMGILCFAKCFHQEAFSDIDFQNEYKRFVITVFGKDQWSDVQETYVYPPF